MGLIKSENAPTTVAAFSMQDIEAHARKMLLTARRQAEQLIAEAQKEGEEIKKRAAIDGFAAGRRDGTAQGMDEGKKTGHAQALAENQEAMSKLIAALTVAANTIEADRFELESQSIGEVVKLASAIARRVTKRQGIIDEEVLMANIKDAMSMVVHAADVRIAIHPTEFKKLETELPWLKMTWPQLKHIEMVEDAGISPGGAKIFTAHGQIDAALDAQLDHVISQLMPDPVAEGAMNRLAAQMSAVEAAMPYRVIGQVKGIGGLTIEASDLALPVGSLCRITSFAGNVVAEVIGFQHDRTLLMALGSTSGISRGDRVENLTAAPTINCSAQMLGRVLNGFGHPIDGGRRVPLGELRRIDVRSVDPMLRQNINEPICTSVRAIDGLLTCGLGQRMGIFSGPGVGKSTLLSQIAKYSGTDVSVVALVGERGREVQEFIHKSLGEEGLKRCVVVVSTSDEAPLLRVRAARTACTVAEYFRDQGKNVLLLVDSITRMCQAQRQIGLAARAPPATKGFPPSVFGLLPEILERAGKTARGSITGFYTVLVEGDDFNEPIPDAVKGITDGHLWLTRALANRGHFPALDILQSLSRVREDVVPPETLKQAVRVMSLTTIYKDLEDLLNIGAYAQGVNLEFDLAVQARPKIVQFLQQNSKSPQTLEQSVKQLADLSSWIEQLEKAIRAQASQKTGQRGK